MKREEKNSLKHNVSLLKRKEKKLHNDGKYFNFAFPFFTQQHPGCEDFFKNCFLDFF